MVKMIHYVRRIRQGCLKDWFFEWKWIFINVKKHIWSIGAYTALGLSGTVISLLSSLISRDLVDMIMEHRTTEIVYTFCMMIGITLLSSLVGQVSSYISTKIGLRVENDLKAETFDQIMNTKWESLLPYHSGDLLMRFNQDVSIVSGGLLSFFPNVIISVFQFLSALIMVLYYDASFAVFSLISIPVSLFISKESLRRMQKNNMNSMIIGSKISGFNQEAFSNVQNVKAFAMVDLYRRRLRAFQKEYTNARMNYQKVTIINSMILTVLSMLVSYAAQGWGIYKVWTDAISYGTMVMFLSLSTSLSGSVNSLIGTVPNAIVITNALRRLREIQDMPKEDDDQSEIVQSFYRHHKEDGIGVFIRELSYTYDSGTEVLKKVTIDAFPYEMIALVGPSGQGKTTIMRYLLSLIGGQEGKGYLCVGKQIPEESGEHIPLTASVRQLCAYVPQGNTLFTGTIADNLRNVKEDATDDEIIEALETACAWEFVGRLEKGIYSEIKEKGNGFSEGQAQRIAIARALVKKAPILLLDEATSALDMETEEKVLRNILNDQYPRTTILTTHRPSVLTICNKVYEIRDKECVIV